MRSFWLQPVHQPVADVQLARVISSRPTIMRSVDVLPQPDGPGAAPKIRRH
ncbi:MAG: hypothetical protein R2838_23990 [Caldilineaceae bacterium]